MRHPQLHLYTPRRHQGKRTILQLHHERRRDVRCQTFCPVSCVSSSCWPMKTLPKYDSDGQVPRFDTDDQAPRFDSARYLLFTDNIDYSRHCAHNSNHSTPQATNGLSTVVLPHRRVQASTSGERVPARGGHTCVVADFQLVVFGGTYYKGQVS